jgi:hypothetical protein
MITFGTDDKCRLTILCFLIFLFISILQKLLQIIIKSVTSDYWIQIQKYSTFLEKFLEIELQFWKDKIVKYFYSPINNQYDMM